ncbi:MAG: AbrB/MazE/SpoVT family DNA-binding domain-containing protein [Candidatus Thiodiazotropha lotti]|uniref:AbrB family transcriptional regulator n=1 Tax=Candidatus Thiodiazotropha endoloripes TaxID=1818881 RepID=A0A1E2UUA7_9GAMM|nr:AbrB/MazE/SpoVT family DNA-binding domain-containing protein [Candidatus Thiodiazotropha endoloripes]MCG7897871.1 AbrB/MazE/SpoVT family DNA-binding domain-containing protein [Candidatus Thiodiazotropha weberae]MCG7990999.1 AbrB/MazE/SpoVT family DNA-binding domain-containing protein [Candidatus Thiodiazotropha lotti]MCG7904747.1 AbrB/MazE/SpoVT family DNA-binding domain-containing protein [Candidatus Thiodiazotropha weberae]MCG7914554.1 AbrB/MazE/SpoVT family DNA-binding domain-containing p
MPKVSAKRQITLPVEQCRVAGIGPGDEYQCFVDGEGHITIIKKAPGAARGILKGLKSNPKLSDEESLQSSLNK